MIVALIVGTLLSLVVLGYVLAPLVLGVKRAPAAPTARRNPERAEDISITALREIEFDRATGKLSDADYAVLRERYASQALAAMRAGETGGAGGTGGAVAPVVDDPAEAAIRAYRGTHPTCDTCGIRPEADALYCSSCGLFLPGKCRGCGHRVTHAGVRFCSDCGTRLAA